MVSKGSTPPTCVQVSLCLALNLSEGAGGKQGGMVIYLPQQRMEVSTH